MRSLMVTFGAVGFLALNLGAASAQGFNVQIGEPGYERVERRVYREERPAYGVRRVEEYGHRHGHGTRVIERRIVTPARARTVCRTEIRERIRRDGAYVRKPVRVCRQIVGAGRAYVD